MWSIGWWLVASAAWASVDLAPPAQARFDAAERAWVRGDLSTAEAAYIDVNESAPEYAPAFRRRCGLLLESGRISEALVLCRRAVALDASVPNRTALAIALVQRRAGDQAIPTTHLHEAGELLTAVRDEDPSYVPAMQAECTWAEAAGDEPRLAGCVAALQIARPGAPTTLYVRALLDHRLGDHAYAADALRRARAAGLPDPVFRPLALRIEASGADVADDVHPPRRDAASPIIDALPWLAGAVLLLSVATVSWSRREDAETL